MSDSHPPYPTHAVWQRLRCQADIGASGLEVVAHELPLPAVSDVQLRHKIFHPCGLVELSRWAPVSRSLLQGIGNGMWEISGLEE